MGRLTPAVAGLVLCVVAACADLPPLGECGNGVVETNLGEDCDDPDATSCLACRLVCDADLPEGEACPDGARCCLAGQRCGQDGLCRAPSGLFSPPTAAFPFPATQIAIIDVDADGIGDAFGVNRQQTTFLYGAIGGPTRVATAPIPAQSQPESQVIFAELDRGDGKLPAIVAGTARGFAVLVTDGSRMFSPPLPEVELEEPGPGGGDGMLPDHGLAAAATGNGDLLALIAEYRSDSAGGIDRVGLRLFRDRMPVPTPDLICGQDFPLVTTDQVFGDMRVAKSNAGEYAFVSVAALVDVGAGPVIAGALCMVETPPVAGAQRIDFTLPADRYPFAMRPVELDGDPCPEVVVGLSDDMGANLSVRYWDTGGTDCSVVVTGGVAVGHLLGAGDLDGDGRDEVLIGRAAYTGVLAGAAQVPDLVLPEGLDVAVVADVNRDGRADVAAIATDARDLIVVLQVDAGFAPRTVPSVGALRELVTNDFDADTYADIATIEVVAGEPERVVVAFGGPTGPQSLDIIGRIPGAHGLVAHIDGMPVVSSDAFADLLMIDVTFTGVEEVSQFNGSSTRALTSQIDLTGPPPAGDGGETFARTIAGGELVAPYGDADDFCTVSFGNTADEPSFAWAFCAGGQGEVITNGNLDDAGALSAGGDILEPGEVIPLVAGAEVASPNGGDPRGVIVALRRDLYTVPELIVMAPPSTGPVETIATARLADRFTFPELAPGAQRFVFALGLHAIQLDDDVDSELIVALYDLVFDVEGRESLSSVVYRVDLSAPGGVIDAVVVPISDPREHACADAALVELGDVMPDGTPAAPGPELVLACTDSLEAWYRGADGTVVGPFTIGRTDGVAGPIAVGDFTGDRLDDLAILLGTDRDALLVLMPQCPAHDTSACTTSIPVGDP